MWLISAPLSSPAFEGLGRPQWADGSWAHRAVMSLFAELPGESHVREQAGILFRVEPGRIGRVLVQATVKPHPREGVAVTSLDPLLTQLRPDMAVAAKVRLNCVVSANRTVNGALRRTRIPVPDTDLQDWALSKLSFLQFDDSASLSQATLKAKGVPLRTVTVEGTATVVDAEVLRQSLRSGVGKARAFGCGLVSIAPMPR